MTLEEDAAHVLLIEPDAVLRRVLALTLADDGRRVTTRSRLGDDLAAVAALEPDLIVLELPAGTLAAGVLRLRTHPATARTPILLCTGAVREAEALAEPFAAIGVPVMTKPFDVDDLLARVRLGLDSPGESSDGHSGSMNSSPVDAERYLD